MSRYSIEGLASHSSKPIVKVASTATDALVARSHLVRVCGRYGAVSVYGQDGREITPYKLQILAREEGAGTPG